MSYHMVEWWHEIGSMRCVSHQRAKTLLTRACSPLAPKNDGWHISKFNLLCDHRGRRLQAGLISPLSVAAVPSISPDNLPNSFICSSSTASPMAVVGHSRGRREVFHFDRATFEIEMGSRVISSVDTDHSPLDARLYLSVEVK